MARFGAVDVVVVGAGAMGSATAWWLARRGRSVVLVEQFEQGHHRGSSHGGSRIFRLAYPDPVYVGMARQALALWREAEAVTGVPMLDTTGGVDHGDPQVVEAVAGALRAAGAPVEELSPQAAGERFPGLRFDRVVAYQPDAGRCLADQAVRAFQDDAARSGVDVRFEVGRADVVLDGTGIRVTAPGLDGEIRARVAVVTAGAWAAPTAGHLVPLPRLEVTQEQVVHFPAHDPVAEWPSFIHHRDTVVYGLRTPGEGVKVGGHHDGPAVDADTRGFELDEARIAAAVRYATAWVPGVAPTPEWGVTCLYANTPDTDFRMDRRGPVVLGSACSGHGFKFTPLVGRILADLAEGEDGRWDVHPGDRFRLLS